MISADHFLMKYLIYYDRILFNDKPDSDDFVFLMSIISFYCEV